MLGIQAQDRAVGLGGFGQLIILLQQAAKTEMGFYAFGHCFHGTAVLLDGFLRIVHLAKDTHHMVIRFQHGRIRFQRLPVFL